MNKKQKNLLARIIVAAIFFAPLFLISEEIIKVNIPKWAILILFMVPYLTVGHDILRKAFKGIVKKQVFDEEFLMTVATIGAIVLGEYGEGVAVMLLYQVGELFQSAAVGKSRKSITELMDIRPDYANLEKEDGTEKVDPDEVEVGSVIVIRPGEKVPIDGIVIEGETALNTSALTGESKPQDVKAGDEILSGSINMTGLIRVRTTKEFDESTASKILDLVENAASNKSKSENFISKFARVYTPIVCYAALAVAIIPPVILMLTGLGEAGYESTAAIWRDWVFRACTFLVISCPCALVISIPLGFFAGLGGASSRGILIKGSNYMETLSQVKT
ncbi:MAG: HAD-IC family P-type ATPase, partial [Firmicutes bacterium]|nr:HAD-IC family P-type ATPase [Bacillota bacterium]